MDRPGGCLGRRAHHGRSGCALLRSSTLRSSNRIAPAIWVSLPLPLYG